MNRRGVALDDLGLGAAMTALVAGVVRPFAALLFPEVGGASLDGQHAFVVAYSLDGDRSLDFHVDDGEVTLNLCLAPGFTGGALRFRGRRCALHQQEPERDEEIWDWAHRPGVAVLHAGRHRHEAHPIAAGLRRNLIVWCRSSAARRRSAAGGGACPDWCRERRRA